MVLLTNGRSPFSTGLYKIFHQQKCEAGRRDQLFQGIKLKDVEPEAPFARDFDP